MCSTRKGKIPLIASRRVYLTYRPKHNISNSKELSTHFGIVDVSLPETIQCFIEPLFYVSQFICDFILGRSFISKCGFNHFARYRNHKQ
ncbi:hypothetical protein Hanom_Chr16g01507291 [Helianthus anomalus]